MMIQDITVVTPIIAGADGVVITGIGIGAVSFKPTHSATVIFYAGKRTVFESHGKCQRTARNTHGYRHVQVKVNSHFPVVYKFLQITYAVVKQSRQ
jgi:hypothetical protein